MQQPRHLREPPQHHRPRHRIKGVPEVDADDNPIGVNLEQRPHAVDHCAHTARHAARDLHGGEVPHNSRCGILHQLPQDSPKIRLTDGDGACIGLLRRNLPLGKAGAYY